MDFKNNDLVLLPKAMLLHWFFFFYRIRLSLQMTRMEIGCNLKKIGHLFHVLKLYIVKFAKSLLWFVLPVKFILYLPLGFPNHEKRH